MFTGVTFYFLSIFCSGLKTTFLVRTSRMNILLAWRRAFNPIKTDVLYLEERYFMSHSVNIELNVGNVLNMY